MDQYPGSGEGGGFIAPQGIAPDYTPAFTPVQAPPKKKKRWIWIAGAGVVIVAAALVLVLCLSPKPGGGAVPDPMVYAEGEDVFLAAGAESIQLDDASFVEGYESRYLNATLSADGKTLYYLADVSSSSGEGDLMRVSVGSEKARPECIAQDVYSAKISADGKKVLYLSDYKDGGGDLYLCAPGGDAEKIAESVPEWDYGFSPDADYAYMVVMNDSDDYTLLRYAGGETEAIADIEDETVNSVFMGKNGKIFYKTYSGTDGKYSLYLYSGSGDPERVCRGEEYIYTYPIHGNADEMAYAVGQKLYYYNKGDEERLSNSFAYIYFPSEGRYDPRVGNDSSFFFTESDGSGDYTLFAATVPGDPVEIEDMASFMIDSSGQYVAFTTNDKLYLVRKAGGGWGEREKLGDAPSAFCFNEAGTYLYYIMPDDEYSYTLCRVSLSGGKEEVLLDDVSSFLLSGDSVYAVDDEGRAYQVFSEDENEKIEKDINTVLNSSSGVYLTGCDGELYYLNGTETERVSSEAAVITLNGYIEGAFD